MSENIIKKKHKTLTLVEKLEILEKLDKGSRPDELSEIYGVGRTTIFDIKRKRNEIENFIRHSSYNSEKRTMRGSSYPELEKFLYDWYVEERRNDVAINTEMLKSQSKIIAQNLGIYNFPASGGWMNKFKKRYDIRLIKKDDLNLKVEAPSYIDILEEKSNAESGNNEEICHLEIAQVYTENPSFYPATEPYRESTDEPEYRRIEDNKPEAKTIFVNTEPEVHFLEESTPVKRQRINEESTSENTSKYEDEFDNFGKLIASQLRNLPLDLALECEDKILAVVRKERLNHFHKGPSSTK